MKNIVLAVALCVSATVGCNEESAGRPSSFNNAAKAPHPTSYKQLLSEGKKDNTRLTGYDAKNILASKPIERTAAMQERDCAILYDTASRHELALQKGGDPDFDRKMARNSYELFLAECPESPHAEEARLALKNLGAQLQK